MKSRTWADDVLERPHEGSIGRRYVLCLKGLSRMLCCKETLKRRRCTKEIVFTSRLQYASDFQQDLRSVVHRTQEMCAVIIITTKCDCLLMKVINLPNNRISRVRFDGQAFARNAC